MEKAVLYLRLSKEDIDKKSTFTLNRLRIKTRLPDRRCIFGR